MTILRLFLGSNQLSHSKLFWIDSRSLRSPRFILVMDGNNDLSRLDHSVKILSHTHQHYFF